jgi:hypothetical protein
MPSTRVILLTGAPAASSLDPESCTINAFTHPFSQYLGFTDDAPFGSTCLESSPHAAAAWRSLPLTRQALPTSFLFSQTHAVGGTHHDAEAPYWSRSHFFTTAEVLPGDATTSLSAGEEPDALTQFCEQSLAEHDAAPPSPSPSQSFDTTATTDTSFITNSTATDALPAPPPAIPSHLSDLEDIPPASTILSFVPQTITINLIIGIISIAQPRTVTTRWGKTLSLVEILVGDETSSGFGVTFWLPSDNATSSEVSKLRRQDVVLMRNVALRVFRGKVYGQSLRGGLTKLSLLWRRDGGAHYSSRDLHKKKTEGIPQLEKTRQVKDWLLKFVGAWHDELPKSIPKSWDKPPDDTQ